MMAAALRNQLQERALYAERLLEQLRPSLQKLREATISSKCQAEAEKLKKENAQLNTEINKLVQRLRDAEARNGVKQFSVSSSSSVPVQSSTGIQEKTTPKQQANESKQDSAPDEQPKKQEKKVKPKKEKAAQLSAEDSLPVDVSRLLLKVGKIVEVKKHPDADSLYVETVDLAEEKPRTILSGLVKHVPIEKMQDRLAVFACNLKPAKMRGILSEGMIMCASTPDKVQIVDVPQGTVPGDVVTFKEYQGKPDTQLNPKKKIWEALVPDFKTNNEGVACYKGSPFTIEGKGVCQAPGCPNFPIK